MQPDIGPVCQSHLEFMKWADDTMLAALSQAPPDQINEDRGSSFKSLFETLNHVYLAELVWLKRVQGNPDAKLGELPSPADLSALAQAWSALHQTWIDWARSHSSGDLQNSLIFRTRDGGESQMPLWRIVLHVVNHGSYHRGQVATMLRQSGIKPPGTDLLTYYRTH